MLIYSRALLGFDGEFDEVSVDLEKLSGVKPSGEKSTSDSDVKSDNDVKCACVMM